MSAPDFQTLMLPALQVFADEAEHSNRDVRERVAKLLDLSEATLAELRPGGTQSVFENRVHWALWYLRRCGLLVGLRRGVCRLNGRGRQVLAEKPVRIDLKFLSRFPEYATLRSKTTAGTDDVGASTHGAAMPVDQVETPDALLARAWEEHRGAIEDDILQRLLAVTPRRFESIVIELLVAMGYGGSFADAAKRIGRTGDGGIDGIIKEDRLGLDAVYVQAKRWKGNVGRPELQTFAGSLQGAHASKGIFITTSQFTREATEYAVLLHTPRIILLDGFKLAGYLFEFNVGVRNETVYAVKRIDEDFFEEQ